MKVRANYHHISPLHRYPIQNSLRFLTCFGRTEGNNLNDIKALVVIFAFDTIRIMIHISITNGSSIKGC